MTPANPSSSCAQHRDAIASFTCQRCGNFGCVECERRADNASAPLCPRCWALEAQQRASASRGGTGLQTAGLVLGIASIIPCCPLALASLVVNVIAIVNASAPPARDVRWRPIVGLVLTLGFGVLQVLFVALYQVFQTPR